ncbi:MAG TPA: histidinol-phosphatase HisJ family protein [Candidatus Fimivivens faecavium]|nr:histidinol-phosphatase HisJ family protein [Candidatus Fimivivens faecavium]
MQTDLFDSHVHSFRSFDAKDSAEALCEAAIRAGLAGISITDHCDVGRYKLDDWRERLRDSCFDAELARKRYAGRLTVTTGIELGQPLEEPSAANEALRANRFDFILASVHNIRGYEDFYFLDYRKLDVEKLLERYFEELYEMTQWGRFDVLAHLTYPLRYIARAGLPQPDLGRYEERFRAIFLMLAQKGMGLEVNTSGLRQAAKASFPGLRELKLFRACGGEIVTLGSDAHEAKVVGSHIRDGVKLLREAGFGYQAFYRNRTPMMIKLL